MSMLFGVSAFAADIDVTNKVGTSLDAWTCENGKKNSVTIDGIVMVENFQDGQTSTSASTTGVVLWQDVAGLDNGNYTVELWANARVAWQDSPATDGQEELTYLVANNVEISMKVFLNPGLNNNATYVLEGVEVTDGTLHIEMNKKAAGSNWHSIQIKKLTYHASDDEALAAAKADLQAALDAAAAVPATEDLTAAIAAAQAIYDGSDLEAIKAAVAPLQAATVLAVNTNAVTGATVSAPVVTNFVVNGTFDTNGVTAPWKTTTKAQNQTTATNQTGAFTGNFFENWNPSSYTGKIYQVIENIPNGLYELAICAFVNTFDASAQYVYANADKKALVAGEPTAYTVRTTVTDNTIEIGLEQITAVANWMGIDNVSLKYFGEVDENYAKDIYASTKAEAEALLTAKMSAEALATLQAALAVEVDETSDEALLAAEAALQEVMATVKASVNFFANNKKAIDAMFALMESTNVYTAEAYSTYAALAEEYLASYEAGTLTATVDNPATVHEWHAEVAYDDLLLSAFGTNNFDTNLYINTWSTEGEGDGSEFKVPFFEYWTGDANSLEATTKTATVTGLVPGGVYTLEAWVRTRAKNGVDAAEATGITLNVGAGDTVDVTEGVVVGTSQFAHAVYTAYGVADENGTLTINFNVLADNNVSWLSFKNLKYAKVPANNIFGKGYAEQISTGNHFVYYTDSEGGYHFLHAAGANNWAVTGIPTTMSFTPGNVTDGSAFATAANFMESNGKYMSNAANYDGTGAIKTEDVNGSNGKNQRTWESQVFYKNAAGKYAIRLTNNNGSDWGANCFVNIDPATFKVASGQPSLGDALYLWQVADESETARFLEPMIAAAESIDGIMNKEVEATLDSIIAVAKVVEPAEVSRVIDELTAAVNAANASIADYEKVLVNIAALNDWYVASANKADTVKAVISAAEAAYADRTATAETNTQLVGTLAYYLDANAVEGLVNGDFSNDTNGWTGSTMSVGNHNKWTNVNNKFVEKWVGSGSALADLDFYQEVSGLPAGVYTVTAYAAACRQNQPDEYEVKGVKLYANDYYTDVHTINIDRDDVNKAIGAELIKVNTVVGEDSLLKVGFSVTGTDANWVVLDNVKIFNFGYASIDEARLPEVKEAFVAKAQEFGAFVEGSAALTMLNGIKGTYAWPLFDVIDPLLADINNVTDVALLEAQIAAMDEAIAVMEQAVVVYAEYQAVVNSFWDAAENSEALNQDVADMRDMALQNSNYVGMMAATVEALEAAVVEIKAAYFAYVSNAVANEGFKFDATFMIVNPSFETGNLTGWEAKQADDTGVQLNSNATYTMTGCDGEYVFNTWHGAGIYVQQTVKDLPAGVYALNLVAASDANVLLDIVVGNDTVQHTCVGDKSTGNEVAIETIVHEGGDLLIKVATVNDDWFKADNFRLYTTGACKKTYDVVLEDVKVTDWATETVISAEVMAEIVELLGAPAAELTYQLVDTTGVHTNYNGNAGEVLFWVDLEGNLSNWGVNNKFFLKYDAEAQTITSTQMGVAEGDVLNATVRLANAEGKYVVINITESIFVSPVVNIADFDVVSTITVKHNENAGVAYSAATASFDPISTAAALGVASLDEAEQYILNVTTGNLVANTTDGWRDANGDAAPWGNEGGVCVKIQKPSSGSIDYIGCIDTTHEVGEVYTAKWAFVHEGKAVVIEVVITFVDGSGIENIEAIQNAVIYTISGKRVQSDVESLERGIYIVNGKKVFVK